MIRQKGSEVNILKPGLMKNKKMPIINTSNEIIFYGREDSIMRIEAYSQVNSIYKADTVKKSKDMKRAGVSDQVVISSAGKDYQAAKAAIAKQPDIRTDLTESIKSRIDSGAYQVSGNDFANKVLEKYQSMMLYNE